jgi:hypothetical protein
MRVDVVESVFLQILPDLAGPLDDGPRNQVEASRSDPRLETRLEAKR